MISAGERENGQKDRALGDLLGVLAKFVSMPEDVDFAPVGVGTYYFHLNPEEMDLLRRLAEFLEVPKSTVVWAAVMTQFGKFDRYDKAREGLLK